MVQGGTKHARLVSINTFFSPRNNIARLHHNNGLSKPSETQPPSGSQAFFFEIRRAKEYLIKKKSRIIGVPKSNLIEDIALSSDDIALIPNRTFRKKILFIFHTFSTISDIFLC